MTNLPITEDVAGRTIALLFFNHLKEEQIRLYSGEVEEGKRKETNVFICLTNAQELIRIFINIIEYTKQGGFRWLK